MKYAGMIILIISSTGCGIYLSNISRKRILICRELISLCDGLLLDLNYKVTPAAGLLENVIKSRKLSHLQFVDRGYLITQKHISTVLSQAENEEISRFLFSLGKSDINTQIKLISDFKEYIKNRVAQHTEKHKKDSKLFVSFGLFFGIVFSIIWS